MKQLWQWWIHLDASFLKQVKLLHKNAFLYKIFDFFLERGYIFLPRLHDYPSAPIPNLWIRHWTVALGKPIVYRSTVAAWIVCCRQAVGERRRNAERCPRRRHHRHRHRRGRAVRRLVTSSVTWPTRLHDVIACFRSENNRTASLRSVINSVKCIIIHRIRKLLLS